MKVVAIIQARVGSTRLPNKVLKTIQGKTILSHQIERLRLSKEIDEIIIATTVEERDISICREAEENNLRYFRGSETDVLSRFMGAAAMAEADVVVRLTSDCPLMDPFIIDKMILKIKEGNHKFISNAGALANRTFPRGLDIEVFTFDLLNEAYSHATETYQREHVTPYLYENCKSVYYFKGFADYSKYRWTLDTEEDWQFISKVYDHFYKGKHDFFYDEILEFIINNPQISKINEHVEQAYIQKDLCFTLRLCDYNDMDLVFEWVNDPSVREQSFSQDPITYKEHVNWFNKQMSANPYYYFIAEYGNQPVGQIRLNLYNDTFIISYLIAKEYRGQGHGKRILNEIELEVLKQVSKAKLLGEVKKDNLASQKAFMSLGYECSEHEDHYTYTKTLKRGE